MRMARSSDTLGWRYCEEGQRNENDCHCAAYTAGAQHHSKALSFEKTTQTSYIATLAAEQAKDELLDYAVEEYQKGAASISELVRKTGLDVTTIMDAIPAATANDRHPIETFLAAAETISRELKDDAFYKMALKAAEIR